MCRTTWEEDPFTMPYTLATVALYLTGVLAAWWVLWRFRP